MTRTETRYVAESFDHPATRSADAAADRRVSVSARLWSRTNILAATAAVLLIADALPRVFVVSWFAFITINAALYPTVTRHEATRQADTDRNVGLVPAIAFVFGAAWGAMLLYATSRVPPSIGWSLVLLGLPVAVAATAVFREYRGTGIPFLAPFGVLSLAGVFASPAFAAGAVILSYVYFVIAVLALLRTRFIDRFLGAVAHTAPAGAPGAEFEHLRGRRRARVRERLRVMLEPASARDDSGRAAASMHASGGANGAGSGRVLRHRNAPHDEPDARTSHGGSFAWNVAAIAANREGCDDTVDRGIATCAAAPRFGHVLRATRERIDTLSGALARGEMSLFLEPIRSLRHDGPVPAGCEFVARTQSTGEDCRARREVVVAARHRDVLRQLDEWLVLAAADAIAANSAILRDYTMYFVRVSAAGFVSAGGLNVLESVRRSGIDAAKFCFILTGLASEDGNAAFSGVAANIRKRGFRVALTFGEIRGDALTHLRQTPLDFLTIDADLVAGVPADPCDRDLVLGLSRAAGARGIATIAEGVDTRAQLTSLRGLGIDYAQGRCVGTLRPVTRGSAAARSLRRRGGHDDGP